MEDFSFYSLDLRKSQSQLINLFNITMQGLSRILGVEDKGDCNSLLCGLGFINLQCISAFNDLSNKSESVKALILENSIIWGNIKQFSDERF